RWDHEQKVAAEELATKLSKNPPLVRAQLEETPHGAALLTDRLTALVQIPETEAFTPTQHSYALDLLGLPTEVRQAGRAVLDAPAGEDPRSVARAVLQDALAQLQEPTAVATRAQLDQSRHRQAMQGTPVKTSRERRLMKRYESMHTRR